MSAMPVTFSIDPVPTTIARAYDELADGLGRLATALHRGDLTGLIPPRRFAGHLAPVEGLWSVPVAGSPRGERFLASMGLELLKTGVFVLAAYQGLLTVLPAPDRPTFAPSAVAVSPPGNTVLPSVTSAAQRAVDGQLREVEVDGNDRSRHTAVP
jgi:hypothetical protein